MAKLKIVVEKHLVSIRRDGDKRLQPMQATLWFSEHTEDWIKLKNGETIFVPEDVAKDLINIIVDDNSKVVNEIKKSEEEVGFNAS